MIDRTFVDTNVLVHAHDLTAGAKRDKARRTLDGLWETRSGVVSTQVLHEFYVTVTRKIAKPLSRDTARRSISAYASWAVALEPSDLETAFSIEDRAKIGFWML